MAQSHQQSDPQEPGQHPDVLATRADWLEQQQPAYLIAALGRPGPLEWRELALEIDRYRRAAGISSRVSTLGASPPSRTSQSREWQQLARRISQYQGVGGVGFDELCAFPDRMQRSQEQAVVSLLEACRWVGVLAPGEIRTIIRMPSLALRRHVTFAALLVSGPARRSMKLSPLQADLADLPAHQATHEPAARHTRVRLRALADGPDQDDGAAAVWLQAKLELHQVALARLPLVKRKMERLRRELRPDGTHHARPNPLHQLPVAIGLHSAYELQRRDLEVLIAIEHDPPQYFARALGMVPTVAEGRAAWREGARLIERYRAQHGIEDPHEALGPFPSSPIDKAPIGRWPRSSRAFGCTCIAASSWAVLMLLMS
jgi:hypothetical protein